MNGTKTDLNRWLDTFIATDIQNMNRNALRMAWSTRSTVPTISPLGLRERVPISQPESKRRRNDYAVIVGREINQLGSDLSD